MQSVSVVQQHPYPLSVGPPTLAIQRTPNRPVVVPINRDMRGYLVVSAQGVTIVMSVDIKFRNVGHTFRVMSTSNLTSSFLSLSLN